MPSTAPDLHIRRKKIRTKWLKLTKHSPIIVG